MAVGTLYCAQEIDIAKVTTGARVALRNDSYTLHLLLPTKVCRLRIRGEHRYRMARVHHCARSRPVNPTWRMNSTCS